MYDMGQSEKSETMLYNWLFFNKDNIDQGSGITASSFTTKDNSNTVIGRKIWQPGLTEKEKKKRIYGTKMIEDIEIRLGNYNHIFKGSHDIFGDIKVETNNNTISKINSTIDGIPINFNEENEISNILNKLEKSNIPDTDINNIIAHFGFKRFGDWFQSALIKKMYNDGYFTLETDDFWNKILAIFIGCTVIYTYTNDKKDVIREEIYNCNIKPERPLLNNIYKLEDSNLRPIDINLDLDIYTDTYTYQLPKGYLSVLINKYLKYKLKYLKQKKQLNINKINNIIKYKKIELYNNIDNINYQYIKQKYLKYKNKYLLLNSL
jgi:hypothetical protein